MCDMLKAAYHLAISAAHILKSLFWGVYMDGKDFGGLSPAPIIDWYIEFYEAIYEQGSADKIKQQNWGNMRHENSTRWGNESSTEELFMDHDWLDGACGSFGGGMKVENDDRVREMLIHLEGISRKMRAGISDQWDKLFSSQNSNLVSLTADPRFIDIHDRMKHNMSSYER